ncbi:beta-phosphoglucomutase [Mycoplasmoides gallisepticum]|uniref:beta-phosphoglucomutase n=1 Tax=Mycoplasmoides gallisepticum TaxID=2096 RepID=UPI0037049097
MIKGFIFDLDGVITDTAKLHYLAWKKIVAQLGINFLEEENEKLKGLSRLDTLKAILKLKKPKSDLSQAELIKICEQKNDLYKKLLTTGIDQNSILKGIDQLIIKAKANKIKLAVASSSHNVPLILEKLGLLDSFDYIVNPSEINQGKPAADIYLKAAEGLDISTDQAIGFEDAISGLKAIKAAKMKAVVITHGGNEYFSKADLIYQSTSELNFDFIMRHFQ